VSLLKGKLTETYLHILPDTLISSALTASVIWPVARNPSSSCASSARHGGEQQRLVRFPAFALFTLSLLASPLARGLLFGVPC
jgi:hypothetical protein